MKIEIKLGFLTKGKASFMMKQMKCEILVVGPLETNCYFVYSEETRECVIFDPGAEPGKIIQAIAFNNLNPVALVNTHGHIDHIGANREIKERFNIPLSIHRADSPMLRGAHQLEMALLLGASESPEPDAYLQEGDEVDFGEDHLKVIHTPGHSPGSLSFLGDGFLLSGDTLFWGGVGRTDLPGGSWGELEASIRSKIFTLPDETIVFPGHGPRTFVRQEKDSNPYLR
jgi:glyoxylase-like metal-dependent hydrolase (beta-lactamase superfamily II)